MPTPEERTEHYESIDVVIVPPNKQMNATLQWQSRLQTETALSTMKAEVIALAAYMRELIPIVDMVKELTQSVGLQARM